jgi:hypothetical protein
MKERAARPRRPAALLAVKGFHSLAFWIIQSAILYLIYKGLKRESDKRAAVAFAITAGECVIYAGNGFQCPLTRLAEDLGAERGAVTDIFLPSWLASNIVRIYVPLFALGMVLHARNLLRPFWLSPDRLISQVPRRSPDI